MPPILIVVLIGNKLLVIKGAVLIDVNPGWGYKKFVKVKAELIVFVVIDDVVKALFDNILALNPLNCVPPMVYHIDVEPA